MKNFPHGSCGDTSILLGQYFFDQSLGLWEYASGEREPDLHSHAWLERDGLIVDITADQVSPAVAKVRIVRVIHVLAVAYALACVGAVLRHDPRGPAWHERAGQDRRACRPPPRFPSPGPASSDQPTAAVTACITKPPQRTMTDALRPDHDAAGHAYPVAACGQPTGPPSPTDGRNGHHRKRPSHRLLSIERAERRLGAAANAYVDDGSEAQIGQFGYGGFRSQNKPP